TRYAVFAIAVWLMLWVVLSGVLRARKIREATPPPRQLATEFAFSLRSMAVFATAGVLISLLERVGVYPLPAMAAHWGPIWLWISFAVGVVAHDAYVYWTHRLMHD